MVSPMNKRSALWTSPEPLWGRFAAEPDSADAFKADDQSAPAILRFANDDFMEQLFALLETNPRQLGELLARPETWRGPSSDTQELVERVPVPRLARTLARLKNSKAAATAIQPTTHQIEVQVNGVTRKQPLKLYQPAHQRHYLVAANLVCGTAGFPDRGVESGGCEEVKFVLRRLLPDDSNVTDSPLKEYAFVKDANEARWQRIEPTTGAADQNATLAPGEEMLPLFPLNFKDDSGHPRRLLAGTVPVGRREEYMGTRAQQQITIAGTSSGGIAANPSDIAARKEQFKMEVSEPWKNLIRTSLNAFNRVTDISGSADTVAPTKMESAAESANNQAQGQSWLILLDFADYLQLHLKPVWACVVNPAERTQLTTPAQQRLFDWLNSASTALGVSTEWKIKRGSTLFATSLRDALLQVSNINTRKGLEGATRSFPDTLDDGLTWPSFIYMLAGVKGSGISYSAWGIHSLLAGISGIAADREIEDIVPPVSSPATVNPNLKSMKEIEIETAKLDKLVQLVIQAIDTSVPAAPTPPLPYAVRLRDALATTRGDAGWFTMRCVYIRCDCGPQNRVVMSAPSQQFQLANFFDSDAPARAIRITLPLDTTPAGMRKHNKNTAFMISDVLCGQIQRAKGLGLVDLVLSVLPWPFHKKLDVGGVGPCKNSTEANIGMICSLSIPIITICALILLMIIVSLLDFIFRWMPWFITCFPIPGFKAKK